MDYPKAVLHWIDGTEHEPESGEFFDKYNPATGRILTQVARGQAAEAERALSAAERAYPAWSGLTVAERAKILRQAALLLKEDQDEIAAVIALEAGKPQKHALSEVESAVKCGLFFTDTTSQFEARTLTSSARNRSVRIQRQSIGVGVLIPPVNNPIANIAIKTFPALLCGNAAVLKAHEDMPYAGIWFAKLLKSAGVPTGVFSVVQGLGGEVGAVLVGDPRGRFISFTGSAKVGALILKVAADRLVKVAIEAGGKNPFVVCADADLEHAANMAAASAFVDAGQRCAAASRIIVLSEVYEQFKRLFVQKVSTLKVGTGDNDDFGSIINERRLNDIINMIEGAVKRGAKILTGGRRLQDEAYKNGYFLEPTVLENVAPTDEISRRELFGPVATLYRVKDFSEAVRVANDSPYKLSGAIHTKDMARAEEFIREYQAGVVRVNGPTFGSEPHMPFGGLGLSGNGWREGGAQALDFYSEWKQVSIDY